MSQMAGTTQVAADGTVAAEQPRSERDRRVLEQCKEVRKIVVTPTRVLLKVPELLVRHHSTND